MTFYEDNFNGCILYQTPDDKVYKINKYTEEYPNGRTETVTGTMKRVDNKPHFDGLDNDKFKPVDRQDVSFSVIETLKRKLSEKQGPSTNPP
jgi:hypothetical protein